MKTSIYYVLKTPNGEYFGWPNWTDDVKNAFRYATKAKAEEESQKLDVYLFSVIKVTITEEKV